MHLKDAYTEDIMDYATATTNTIIAPQEFKIPKSIKY